MKKISVNLSEDSYSVLIGKSILEQLKTELEKLNLYKNIFIVVDENVAKYHLQKIEKEINGLGKKINYYILKANETIKTYSGLNKIYAAMLEKGYGRDTLVIAVGGGVTGDLAGFAAATYMRGVQLIHIPTTLLAAVDSAIGGKTGVNFQKKKNMIGSFYQPKLVIIDIQFFKTLPKKEKTSGIGEVVKYGYLADEEFFKYLRNNLFKIYNDDEDVYEEVIRKSVGIKAAVVMQDEKETGLRKILNLGHTFAHGLETELNFKVKHGEAVAAGVIAALLLSERIGILDKNKLKEYIDFPRGIKLPRRLKKFSINNVLEVMLHDKKNRDGKIKFVLPAAIGNILLDVEAERKDIIFALKEMSKIIIC